MSEGRTLFALSGLRIFRPGLSKLEFKDPLFEWINYQVEL